jgi:hypothetical protein
VRHKWSDGRNRKRRCRKDTFKTFNWIELYTVTWHELEVGNTAEYITAWRRSWKVYAGLNRMGADRWKKTIKS